MKSLSYSLFVFLGILAFFNQSCKKEEITIPYGHFTIHDQSYELTKGWFEIFDSTAAVILLSEGFYLDSTVEKEIKGQGDAVLFSLNLNSNTEFPNGTYTVSDTEEPFTAFAAAEANVDANAPRPPAFLATSGTIEKTTTKFTFELIMKDTLDQETPLKGEFNGELTQLF